LPRFRFFAILFLESIEFQTPQKEHLRGSEFMVNQPSGFLPWLYSRIKDTAQIAETIGILNIIERYYHKTTGQRRALTELDIQETILLSKNLKRDQNLQNDSPQAYKQMVYVMELFLLYKQCHGTILKLVDEKEKMRTKLCDDYAKAIHTRSKNYSRKHEKITDGCTNPPECSIYLSSYRE